MATLKQKTFNIEQLKEKIKELEKSLRDYPEVYIFQISNYYKIGKSSDVWRRFDDINVTIPYKLKSLFHQQVKNANKLETKIHQRFKNKRIKGEWFKLNKDEVKAIIKWIKKEKL